MKVYVLVATAVYDQGVVGVYSEEALARYAAEKIWPKTDGHHHFRIDVLELGQTYEDVFQYFMFDKNVPPAKPVYDLGTLPRREPIPVSVTVNDRTSVNHDC